MATATNKIIAASSGDRTEASAPAGIHGAPQHDAMMPSWLQFSNAEGLLFSLRAHGHGLISTR